MHCFRIRQEIPGVDVMIDKRPGFHPLNHIEQVGPKVGWMRRSELEYFHLRSGYRVTSTVADLDRHFKVHFGPLTLALGLKEGEGFVGSLRKEWGVFALL